MSTRSTGPGTTAQHALDGLRRDIVAGDLRPGQRILQEDVAERLGVSVAPVREALRVLEQERQVTYIPRRGYFVTELHIEDLEEIYDLRRILEARAARRALPTLDALALERIESAAADCFTAAQAGDVAGELEANRRFHFTMLEAPGQHHAMRIIRVLWDSTEAHRALYYSDLEERHAATVAHDRILDAVRAGNAIGSSPNSTLTGREHCRSYGESSAKRRRYACGRLSAGGAAAAAPPKRHHPPTATSPRARAPDAG